MTGTDRLATWIAFVLAVLGAITFVPASIWQLNHSTSTLSWTALLGQGMGLLALGGVGLVLAVRRRTNSIGWIFLAAWTYAGVLALITALAQSAALRDGQDAADGVATWLVNWMWVPLIGMIVFYPLLLFPTGRVPGPRWRPLLAGGAVVILAWTLSFAFQSAQFTDAYGNPVPGGNPHASPWAVGFVDALPFTLAMVFIVMVVAALVSLVQRFRRGDSETKAQLKWFLLGGLCWLPVLLYPGDHGGGGVIDLLMGLAVAALPAAMAVAILRYRLYDIDRIISRAASYAIVSAVVVLTYAVVVTTVTRLVPSSNTFAVAGATLAAAALVRPLLHRVQDVVDRRFNRTRYDAELTVDAFGLRLRHEVDTEVVSDDLVRLVGDALEPHAIRLWVRRES